ncbi:MAG: hypothetical protein R2734_10085 [Nocardioides sp.]
MRAPSGPGSPGVGAARHDGRREVEAERGARAAGIPGSVRGALWMLGGLVVLSGLTAVLTLVFRDDLVVTWAQGNGAAREILDEGGLAALEDSSINIPAFGAVTVVLFVVFALLALVLASFLRWGHPWARYALTGVVAVMVFSAAVAISRSVPAMFVVISALALAVSVALLVFLWRPDTSDFLRRP